MNNQLDTNIFENTQRVFIRQIKEWGEILIGFEGANKYEILDDHGNLIGYITEQGNGFIKMITRSFLRSHRPLDIKVFDKNQNQFMSLKRSFYFFFSDMYVANSKGELLGSIHQEFAIFKKKYVLKDKMGKNFSSINSGFLNFFNFKIVDHLGRKLGHIKKKWGGIVKEFFTDTDTFGVDMSQRLSPSQKAIVLATAISVDFDYFEDNRTKVNVFNILD